MQFLHAPNSVRLRSLIVIFFVLAASLMLRPNARAQCTNEWVPGAAFPGLDGFAHQSVNWDPDGPGPEPQMLVIVGEFHWIGGIAAHNVAAWDGISWRALGAGVGTRFDPGAGSDEGGWTLLAVSGVDLYAARFQSGCSGGLRPRCWYGVSLHRWNGDEWELVTSFGGGGLGGLNAFGAFNGELVVAGHFSLASLGSTTIARWNGHEWLSFGADPNDEVEGDVLRFFVHDGRLIAAGQFTKIGGVPARNIASWDGQSWQPLGLGLGVGASRLASFHGNLVAAGDFDGSSGDPEHIARWDGSNWQPLGEGIHVSGRVGISSVTAHGDELIVCGQFDQAGGVAVSGGAVWNGAEWSAWNSGIQNPSVLGSCQGSLLGGGAFSTPRGQLWVTLARWDGASWHFFEDGLNVPLVALATYRNQLIGAFEHDFGLSSCNAPIHGRIARWDGHCWIPLESHSASDTESVATMTTHGSDLVVGGGFTSIDGIPAVGVARWDGHQWHALGEGLGNPSTFYLSTVLALTDFEGSLIAGGGFRTTGARSVERIARWSGSRWEPMGAGFPPSGSQFWLTSVTSLIVHQGVLYAGGALAFNGQGFGVARWNPLDQTWAPLLRLNTVNDSVLALAVYRSELIAGGRTFGADGLRPFVSRLDRTVWRPLGELDSPVIEGYGGNVSTLVAHGSSLIAGGAFLKANGTSVHNIARWDGARWQKMGLGVTYGEADPHPYYGSASVRAMTLHNGELAVGGNFVFANGRPSSYFARWRCPPCPADFDASGDVGIQDIFSFLAAYLVRELRADVDASGLVTVADLFEFLDAYFVGCP